MHGVMLSLWNGRDTAHVALAENSLHVACLTVAQPPILGEINISFLYRYALGAFHYSSRKGTKVATVSDSFLMKWALGSSGTALS